MFKNRYLLFCHILVLRFGFIDLLLPFLVHFLLKILLFSTDGEMETEEDREKENIASLCVCVNVCACCVLDTVLLLTDVSELFELSTLALLCYSGQLLNQLERERQRESHNLTLRTKQSKVSETGDICF